MTPTRRCVRGGIYLVKLPHPAGEPAGSDRKAKIRPVLVLQNNRDNLNPRHPTVLVAPLTTKGLDRQYDTDVLIQAHESGLRYDSRVLLGQITTIFKSILGKQVAQLNDAKMDDVETAMLIALGVIEPG